MKMHYAHTITVNNHVFCSRNLRAALQEEPFLPERLRDDLDSIGVLDHYQHSYVVALARALAVTRWNSY